MIKGVNRQIIEVSDTGSKYFEKVILFIRPEYMSESATAPKKHADRLVAGIGKPPGVGDGRQARQKRLKGGWFYLAAGAAILAGLLLWILLTF